MMKRTQRLKVGSIILVIDAIGLSCASMAFLMQNPDVTTVIGRLLCAGAMANLSLATIMVLLAIIPIRRGERWAFWAYSLPFGIYGIPVLLLDAVNVAEEELLSCLVPQIFGLIVGTTGLLLIATVIFRDSSNGDSTAV